jgi:hypothetical protein
VFDYDTSVKLGTKTLVQARIERVAANEGQVAIRFQPVSDAGDYHSDKTYIAMTNASSLVLTEDDLVDLAVYKATSDHHWQTDFLFAFVQDGEII